jgi:hypothetical protein
VVAREPALVLVLGRARVGPLVQPQAAVVSGPSCGVESRAVVRMFLCQPCISCRSSGVFLLLCP